MRLASLVKSLVHAALVAIALGAVFWIGFALNEWNRPQEIHVVPAYPTTQEDFEHYLNEPMTPFPPDRTPK